MDCPKPSEVSEGLRAVCEHREILECIPAKRFLHASEVFIQALIHQAGVKLELDDCGQLMATQPALASEAFRFADSE